MDIYENYGKSYSYEEAKKSAKEFYKTIGVIWCPALNDYISFNKKGFRHLIRKKGLLRTQNEQIERFSLLVHARDILEDPRAIFSSEIRIAAKQETNFWIFSAVIADKRIKIIIQKTGNGEKYFLSIYSKTQKSTQ